MCDRCNELKIELNTLRKEFNKTKAHHFTTSERIEINKKSYEQGYKQGYEDGKRNNN